MPRDAFEMNYVFTDGEGATDNNLGKNYMTPVQGSMTSELWEEKAVERLVSSPPDNIPDAHFIDLLHDMHTMLEYPSFCTADLQVEFPSLVREVCNLSQAGAVTLLVCERRGAYEHCTSSIVLH